MMKVVTVDSIERSTSTWNEFWEIAKREHSEKRVKLEEKSSEISAHIDIYRNTVQARFSTNWFIFNIIYTGVRSLDEVIRELEKSVNEWKVVYSLKYKAEYRVYEREIYYVAIEFNGREFERLEIELLTFEWPDQEKLRSSIRKVLTTIGMYLNTW